MAKSLARAVANESKSTLEIKVARDFVKWVEVQGGICERLKGPRGWFDLLVVLPGGRVIFVECKRPIGGRLSPHQRTRRARYLALGCEVLVVNKKPPDL